jgi:hypothetical protein
MNIFPCCVLCWAFSSLKVIENTIHAYEARTYHTYWLYYMHVYIFGWSFVLLRSYPAAAATLGS